ncbi:MAG: sugar phosphate isomerase/epimerase [Phycisphaerae bacterium]|nr:sugar phosphate isomerase/epimerase [Phycisphaerae bacterium]
MSIPVAVQLYTLRDLIARDFLGTCRSVAKMGYKGVELVDTRSILTAANLKKEMAAMGLAMAGVHVGIEQLESNLDAVVTYYGEAGVSHLVCPYMPDTRRKTADDWKKQAKILATIGSQLRTKGFTFCYHNHDFEFQKLGGTTGWDILFSGTDAQSLACELDVYWVQFAGDNPVTLMHKLSGRLPLLHCKDMAAGPERKFAPVGSGILDWKGIFQAAGKVGVKWYIVEQDSCYETPPLEAVRTSLENLKKMGIV